MTGELGNWSLKPDQMQVINPLLILVFIPIFQTIIYPLLAKCNLLKKPLQRLGVGGVLAAISFIISAIVELQLQVITIFNKTWFFHILSQYFVILVM